MDKILPFESSYWIVPGKLIAGQYPSGADLNETINKLDALVNIGIKVVINLTQAGELTKSGESHFDYSSYLSKHGISVYRMPVVDASIPSKEMMDDIVDVIDESLANDMPVYFHCWGGVGRTGTVAASYLMHSRMSNQKNVFDTMDYVKRSSPFNSKPSPGREEQRQFVLNYKR